MASVILPVVFLQFVVSGSRLRRSSMGYLLDSTAYSHSFENVALRDIRVPPTAFDFLEMCINEDEKGEGEIKNGDPNGDPLRRSSMFY